MQPFHEEALKEIICQNSLLNSDLIEITDDTDLVNDLALDSMAVVNLFADIEEEFGIEIDIHLLNKPVLDKYCVFKEFINRQIGGST